MTLLGIYRLMSQNKHRNEEAIARRQRNFDHGLRRPLHRQEARLVDEAEILKSSPNTINKEEQGTFDSPAPASTLQSLERSSSSSNLDATESQPRLTSKIATTHTKIPTGKMVCFSEVHIRTYEVILGDNLDCFFPLSLGWRHGPTKVFKIDDYEKQKMQSQQQKPSPYAENAYYCRAPLSLCERRLRLLFMGFTELQLRQAERTRQLELAKQWAEGQNPKEEEEEVDFRHSDSYTLNYMF